MPVLLKENGIDENHYTELQETEKGDAFFERVWEELPSWIDCFFRTCQKPVFSIHPQQGYSIALLALICGVIDNKNDFLTGNVLHIHISQRSNVLSEEQGNNKSKYHEEFKKKIRERVDSFCSDRKIGIEVSVGSAFRKVDLMLADFLIGFSRKSYARLNEAVVLQDIEIQKYFTVMLGNNPGKLLIAAEAKGLWPEAFSLLLDVAAELPSAKVKEHLSRIIPKLYSSGQWKMVLRGLNLFGDALLENRGSGGQLMDHLYKISREIYLQSGDNPYLQEKTLFYMIHAATHQGKVPEGRDAVDKYRKFIKISGELVFPAILDRFSSEVEIELIGVQNLYFNNLDFFSLESVLKKNLDMVSKLRKVFSESGYSVRDDLYARLLGTIGQAAAFTGAMEEDSDKLQEAALYLEEDIALLTPDSRYYCQGLSFLHTLFWWRKDIEKCRQLIAQIFNCAPESSAINNTVEKKADEPGSGFILLDWLRYASLDFNQNGNKPDLNILNKIADNKSISAGYPWDLIRKWLAYLFSSYNDSRRISGLKKHINSTCNSAIPLDSLLLFAISAVFNVVQGRDILNNEAEKMLVKAGENSECIASFIKARKGDWAGITDGFEAARILPYYFS